MKKCPSCRNKEVVYISCRFSCYDDRLYILYKCKNCNKRLYYDTFLEIDGDDLEIINDERP